MSNHPFRPLFGKKGVENTVSDPFKELKRPPNPPSPSPSPSPPQQIQVGQVLAQPQIQPQTLQSKTLGRLGSLGVVLPDKKTLILIAIIILVLLIMAVFVYRQQQQQKSLLRLRRKLKRLM